ncbi:uncharacterized protein LOC144441443 isoform X1 [Glandiceps talaboti]
MASHSQTEIPVIDFSAYSLDKDTVCEEKIQSLVDEIHHAFSTIGFIYLKNHGIHPEQVKQVYEVSRKFFALPTGIKMKYPVNIPENEHEHGYVHVLGERANPDSLHADPKECFNYIPRLKHMLMPDEDLPEFREVFDDFYNVCTKLSMRLLAVMAKGLNIETSFFAKAHEGMLTGVNDTSIRTLYYPALSSEYQVKPGQQRCGEHSDYGSITLLFQDNAGGLEVMNTHGKYVAATPIEGTIIVNLGDLMQRWTTDKLKATKHRVVMPTTDEDKLKERQSIAFFAYPDKDFLVECTDGSNKYPPIKVHDYVKQALNAIY